jgi:threonine aldolase
VELDRVETNMVYAEVSGGRPRARPPPSRAGLLVNAVGPHALRLVCHLDVDRPACERAADILRASLEGK